VLFAQLEMHGLDVLWYLTLHTADATVAAASVAFLTLLQQRLSDQLAPRIFEFRKRYLERCMSYIGSAATRGGVSHTTVVHEKRAWPWAADNDAVTYTSPDKDVSTVLKTPASLAGLRISTGADRGMLAPQLLLASHSSGDSGALSAGVVSRDNKGGASDSARLIERYVDSRVVIFVLFHAALLALCVVISAGVSHCWTSFLMKQTMKQTHCAWECTMQWRDLHSIVLFFLEAANQCAASLFQR
jgi:hypothetical protein